MMQWDPTLYLKFGAERTRPAADLLARVLSNTPNLIVDIGCGPGNSTALLRARHPQARLIGVDASADMLADAAKSGVEAQWAQGDFETWAPPEPADLIYSNAALQWADAPLETAKRLFSCLAPGGVLAFQVPYNQDQTSYTEVRDAVSMPRWREALKGVRQYDPGFTKAEEYYRAFSALGGECDIWHTTYLHALEGEDAVFRWMSATGIRPFVQALAGSDRDAFEQEVRARYARAFPRDPDGRTLFAFRRLFAVIARPA